MIEIVHCLRDPKLWELCYFLLMGNAGFISSTVSPWIHWTIGQVQRERAKFAMADAVMRRRPEAVQALLSEADQGREFVQAYVCIYIYIYIYIRSLFWRLP